MARRLVRDFGKLLAGDLGSELIATLRGIAIPLLVTPAQYGLWRMILLVWQYGIYLHLGSFAYLNRELPGLLATGERERFFEMRQTAFWGTMLTSSLGAIGLVALSFTPAAGGVEGQAWALRLAALGAIGQQLAVYVGVDFRVRSRFGSMSLLNLTQAVASLCLMLPLAWIAGVPGLAAGMALASVAAVASFGRRVAFDRPRLRPRAFLGQVRRGIPLSSLPFLNTTITSTGQIAAATFFGLDAAAFYGLGAMIGTVVYAVPRGIGMVLYPRYLASYATEGDPSRIGLPIRRSLRITSVFSATAACVAAILIGPALHLALPAYLPALGPIYVLIAMMPFVAFGLVLQNALLALRSHRQLIAIQATAVVLAASLATLGAVQGEEVVWLAAGVMAAHVFSGIATIWLGLATTRMSDSPARELVAELVPLVVLGSVTAAALILSDPSGDPWSLVETAGVQLLILAPAIFFFGARTWRGLRETP